MKIKITLPSLSFSTWLYIILGAVSLLAYYYMYVYRSDEEDDEPETKEVNEDDDGIDGQRMLIFYGTQTGTAEEFSKNFAEESRRYGFKPKMVDMVDYSPEDLQNEQLAVFIVATYGEGEPTDNARDFYEWLKEEHDPDLLKNLKYTVFGLGNTQYKIYQAMARFFDKRLEELGAQRIYQRGEGDADRNIEEDFEDWKSNALPVLSEEFGTTETVAEQKVEPKYKIEFFEASEEDKTPYNVAQRGFPDAKYPFLSTVLDNRELLNSNERSTVHIEFDITNANIYYEAGDHLAVYPSNEKGVVMRYAKRLGITNQLSSAFKMTSKKDNTMLFPKKTTIETALSYYIDLNMKPRKKIISVMAEYASDEKEKNELRALTANTEEGKNKWKEYVLKTGRRIIDILNDYKSIDIPLELFFEIMPRMQPRYYSIASSSLKHPNSIHLCVALVRYKTPLGKVINGVCSYYIQQLKKNSKAYIFVRKSNFHLPENRKPVIMVGPGTGIAPFIGFLQQRRAELEKTKIIGEGALYFGCRRKLEDYIYQNEQEEAKRDGVITEHYVAFSREQEEKVYVQHLLKKNGEAVWNALKKGGYFYVCGDAKHMAKDVDQTLKEIIMEFGQKTEKEAEDFINQLTNHHRYLRDVWSP